MNSLKMAVAIPLGAATFVLALSLQGAHAPPTYGPPSYDHADLDVRPLSGTVLAESEAFGLPGDLALVGEHLVVVDRLNRPAFHVLDPSTGALLLSEGRAGEGPGEFRAPVALDPLPGAHAFWVYDASLQRLTFVEVANGRLGQPLNASPTIRLRAGEPVIQPLWLPDGGLLAHGFFSTGRLALLDQRGAVKGFLGPLPPNPDDVPASVLQHAYQGTLAAHPDRSRFVLVHRHSGTLELFSTDEGLIRRTSGPFEFDPRFSIRMVGERPAMASGDDLRFGYIDVATTDRWIYALFSGRTRAGFPGRANYASYVHVFDWEGSFVEAWKLDTDAFTITVTEERTLYAVRHEPAPALLIYELDP